MNSPKKNWILFFFVLITGTAVYAFDYGMELSNTAGIKYNNTMQWYTDHKATVWVTIPFDNSNKNSVSIEGSAYASKPSDNTTFKFFADLDLLRLTLVPFSSAKTKIAIDCGRIPVSDITGLVLNQSVDGADFHGSFAFGNIDFLASYTGLQNVRKGGALMSDDDFADANTSDIYAFGASRAIGKLTIQVPHLIGSADLIVEGVGQYDIRRYLIANPTESIDSLYGTISIGGAATQILFYSLSGTFQTGISTVSSGQYSMTSALASVRFDLFPAPKNQLYTQVLFSPGNNAVFSSFVPVTYQSAGTLYTGGYDNLIRVSAGWYFNPFSILNMDINGKVIMHPVETSANAGLYDSTEISAGFTVKATSDLRFRFDSVVLLPNQTANQWQASLKAILDL